MGKGKLEGWAQIESYLGLSYNTIKKHGYPVQGIHGRAFAYKTELDEHRKNLELGAERLSGVDRSGKLQSSQR